MTSQSSRVRFTPVYLVVMLGLSACGSSSDSSDEVASLDETTTQTTTQTTNSSDVATDADETADETTTEEPLVALGALPDTGQSRCFDFSTEITCPSAGTDFYGQDAQFDSDQQSFTNNGDGTVTDNVTGLVWQQTIDNDGDGAIDADDKLTYNDALSYCDGLSLGVHDDWALPTIKQLYSLIDFDGVDPSGYEEDDTSGLIPFIDTTVFGFAYGDTDSGERIIDAQYASSTKYVSTTMNGDETLFGVNFADGRIKGYGMSLFGSDKTFFVQCVRNTESYGSNQFVDNGDGTVTDEATGLMWQQDDSEDGMNWQDVLAWTELQNNEGLLGYSDWRIPNAKELQHLVDYSRSPDASDSAAIDPLFDVSEITNEADEMDYPSYWTSTTHANWTSSNSGGSAVYIAFGRAMGYMNGSWMDVHGAGAQRSDPKSGSADDYPTGHGPQGDPIRILNHVRLVRDAD